MHHSTTLENGIRVVTETIPQVRSVAIGIVVDVGLTDETPDKNGLAHLTEHLMFQGTSSRDAMQIARLMDSTGGHVGAFTARDYTCYSAVVLDDHCPYALDLFGDILLNSIFPEDSVDREKAAILREIEMGNDSPSERAHAQLKAFAWPNHPLGRPVAGTAEIVQSLTREDVIYFMHEQYLPERIIIAAAGRVDHDDFVSQVRDAFWRMLGSSQRKTLPRPMGQSGVTIEHRNVSQAYFSIGLPVYSYAHPRRYEMHILNNVLGGGISSRLFRTIREEQGLVYHIGSEYHAYRDGGMWVIEGSTTPEYLEAVLNLTCIELKDLLRGQKPIEAEELWIAKMQIQGQHQLASEDTYTRMSRLATQALYLGHYLSPDEILGQIESVDDQQLLDVAGEINGDAMPRMAMAIVGPEAPEHYTLNSIETLLASFQ